MIHLIGVNHHVQLPAKSRLAATAKFRKYLLQAARNTSAKAIAEEFNEEAIARWSDGTTSETVAQSVARALRVPHILCDPSAAQRQALGIRNQKELLRYAETHYEGSGDLDGDMKRSMALYELEERKDFPPRERFWIEKLQPVLTAPSILLVCGASHVDSFGKMLDAGGISATVYCANWSEAEP